MKLDLMAVLLTFPALATSACEKRRDEPSTTRTTGATTDPVTGMETNSMVSASTRIAGARCDRETACNQIGPQKRYETRALCTRNQTIHVQSDLRASDCPNGVDEKKLQSCFEMIAKQDCATLASSVTTINECTTSSLCAARP